MQLCKVNENNDIMTNKQKREWAETLYTKEHLTQKEIATRVEASEKTISAWKEKGQWDKLKANYTITKPQQLQRVYAQINELTTVIEQREEGERYANSREADTLTKLCASAKSLESEAGIAEMVNVFIPFLDFIRKTDLSKSQEISGIIDNFIKSRV